MSSDCDLSTTEVDFSKILQVHHTDLRETLNVQEMIPLMRKHGLLTEEECQKLKLMTIDAEKIDQLVHILPRKGRFAYPKFIECLESEKRHLGHPELVVKLKETAAKQKSEQLQPFQSMCTDSKSNQESAADTVAIIRQVSLALNERDNGIKERDNEIKRLNERIASLEAQVQQKDKPIPDLQCHFSHGQIHAVSDVAKFQELLNYVNGGHVNHLHNPCTIADYYRHLRLIMKVVKQYIKEDAKHLKLCVNTTSEESDEFHSKTSSLDSKGQLHGDKVSKFTELSSEAVKEFKEETAEESAEDLAEGSAEETYSSADETDDEILETTLEPEEEHKIELRLKSQQRKRTESWTTYKERRASKGNSCYSMSSITQLRKGSTTDSDANDDTLLQHTSDIIEVAPSGEVEPQNVDVMDCSSVELLSTDGQEKSSCTVLAGYLQKEGTGPRNNRWKRRYFVLTKEDLHYSKSQQDTKMIDGFPLVGLAVERKKKNTFEVINKQATNIKVDRPGIRQVLIANSKVIKLKASSEKEAQKWIQSIDDAIAKWGSQYFPET